jgi:hypothetical protein
VLEQRDYIVPLFLYLCDELIIKRMSEHTFASVFTKAIAFVQHRFFVLLLKGRFKRLLFELVFEKKAEYNAVV